MIRDSDDVKSKLLLIFNIQFVCVWACREQMLENDQRWIILQKGLSAREGKKHHVCSQINRDAIGALPITNYLIDILPYIVSLYFSFTTYKVGIIIPTS